METNASNNSGIVITDVEALEFQKIVNEIFNVDIDINQSTVMGSNAIISLELILQNMIKITDIDQNDEDEYKQ